ncbi:hypothetical protein Tco_0232255 [Tanacetum coccineum]
MKEKVNRFCYSYKSFMGVKKKIQSYNLGGAKTLSKVFQGYVITTSRTKVDFWYVVKGVGQKEGKAPMVEEDIQATHKTKEQMRQEEAGLEEAIKLQA